MNKKLKSFNGIELKKWTSSESDSQHFYFTSPTVTDDDKYLLIIADKGMGPNIYAINRLTNDYIQVSRSNGLLKSYTYPEGGDHGLSKASPFLDSVRNIVYWIQDDSVWKYALDKDKKATKLIDLPEKYITGYPHLSKDGRFLVIPCADKRAFDLSNNYSQEDQLKSIPSNMLSGKLGTNIYLVDIEKKISHLFSKVPFWVTHIQFNGERNDSFIINSEGGEANTACKSFKFWGRIWILDNNKKLKRLFNQIEGSYVNHENITPENNIIYHGRLKRSLFIKTIQFGLTRLRNYFPDFNAKNISEKLNRHFIEIRSISGKKIIHLTVTHPVSHAISGTIENQFVTDSRNGYIYGYYYDNNSYKRVVICEHKSKMNKQDSHPHPKPTKDGRSIIFTTDYNGKTDVYEAILKQAI